MSKPQFSEHHLVVLQFSLLIQLNFPVERLRAALILISPLFFQVGGIGSNYLEE